MKKLQSVGWWFIPLLAMLCLAPFSPWLDLGTARYFYKDQFASHPIYDFLYNHGPKPGLVLGVFSLAIFVLSFACCSLKKWRKPALLVCLTLIIGAGFITHTLLKDHWGRPRPKQVIEFGGNQEFRPFYSPNFFNQPEPSRSFPCGHCTMGFCFFAAGLALRRMGYRMASIACYSFAIVLGAALGLARTAQGGHFVSDVLMTAFIMWTCAGVMDVIIYGDHTCKD